MLWNFSSDVEIFAITKKWLAQNGCISGTTESFSVLRILWASLAFPYHARLPPKADMTRRYQEFHLHVLDQLVFKGLIQEVENCDKKLRKSITNMTEQQAVNFFHV